MARLSLNQQRLLLVLSASPPVDTDAQNSVSGDVLDADDRR